MLRGHETRLTRASTVSSYVTLGLRLAGTPRRAHREINLKSSEHLTRTCETQGRKKSRDETKLSGSLRKSEGMWRRRSARRGNFIGNQSAIWDYSLRVRFSVCVCAHMCVSTLEPNPVGVRQGSLPAHRGVYVRSRPVRRVEGRCVQLTGPTMRSGLQAAAYIA